MGARQRLQGNWEGGFETTGAGRGSAGGVGRRGGGGNKGAGETDPYTEGVFVWGGGSLE